MKNLFLLLLLISSITFAQSPESFKYQALIRNSSGQIVANRSVSIKISILKGAIENESVYTEAHAASTNTFGTINLEIGNGNVITGSFAGINWGSDFHFVKVDMDLDNDNVYENLGVAKLLSVPYALYAQKSGDQKWASNGNNISYNAGKIGVGIETPIEPLHVNGNIRGGQYGGALRIKTDFGYLDVGAKNADYAHFYTDMPYGFYFGGSVTVRDHLIGYRSSDLNLSTQSESDFLPVKRITILNSNGFVGIGTTQPKSQLQVESGDIYLNDATSGVIMKSPNQQCWKLTVSNSGSPVFVSVTCPE